MGGRIDPNLIHNICIFMFSLTAWSLVLYVFNISIPFFTNDSLFVAFVMVVSWHTVPDNSLLRTFEVYRIRGERQ